MIVKNENKIQCIIHKRVFSIPMAFTGSVVVDVYDEFIGSRFPFFSPLYRLSSNSFLTHTEETTAY